VDPVVIAAIGLAVIFLVNMPVGFASSWPRCSTSTPSTALRWAFSSAHDLRERVLSPAAVPLTLWPHPDELRGHHPAAHEPGRRPHRPPRGAWRR